MSKAFNEVMISTSRKFKKKNFRDFWMNNQLQPFLSIKIIFSYRDNALKIVNVNVKSSLVLLNLNGKSLGKLYNLFKQINLLWYQAKALLLQESSDIVPIMQNTLKQRSNFLVSFRISKVKANLYFKNLPDLIQIFSKSYTSKMLALIIKDLGVLKIRFTRLEIDRKYLHDDLDKIALKHYLSQIGTQIFNSLSSTKLLSNPKKLMQSVTEILTNFFSVNSPSEKKSSNLET